jgi:hypothetical protein
MKSRMRRVVRSHSGKVCSPKNSSFEEAIMPWLVNVSDFWRFHAQGQRSEKLPWRHFYYTVLGLHGEHAQVVEILGEQWHELLYDETQARMFVTMIHKYSNRTVRMLYLDPQTGEYKPV